MSRLARATCRSQSYRLFGVPHKVSSQTYKTDVVYPPSYLEWGEPRCLEADHPKQFRRMFRRKKMPECGVLTLHNGIATGTGGNLDTKSKLITTYLQVIDRDLPSQHDLFYFSTSRFFPKIKRVAYPVTTLASGWQGAFYHWLYDVLPRLHLLQPDQTRMFYLEHRTAFQKESLALLGIGEDRIINTDEYQAVQAPIIYVPSIVEIPTPWSCRFLRARFAPHIIQAPKRRLYISRSDAPRRRILNEEAVMSVLAPLGFERVVMEDYTFHGQINLFANAEAIVTPHGAALANMAFCELGTKVLEMFALPYANPCYWMVAKYLGLEYTYVLGEAGNPLEEDPDIHMDLDKLTKALHLLGL